MKNKKFKYQLYTYFMGNFVIREGVIDLLKKLGIFNTKEVHEFYHDVQIELFDIKSKTKPSGPNYSPNNIQRSIKPTKQRKF